MPMSNANVECPSPMSMLNANVQAECQGPMPMSNANIECQCRMPMLNANIHTHWDSRIEIHVGAVEHGPAFLTHICVHAGPTTFIGQGWDLCGKGLNVLS